MPTSPPNRTNVNKILRVWEAIPSLAYNKQISSKTTLLIFRRSFRRYRQICPITAPPQKLKKIVENYSQISSILSFIVCTYFKRVGVIIGRNGWTFTRMNEPLWLAIQA